MRIISRRTLKDYYEIHSETKGALESWYSEVKKEKWSTANDVLKKYPKARTIPGNRIIFKILGNRYRLIVKVNYQAKQVFIRFVGSHKEYDAINAEVV